MMLSIKVSAQGLKGYIMTQEGIPLPGATIMVKELSKGTYSQNSGFFEINHIPYGSYTIEVSYIGYQKYTLRVSLTDKSGNIKIYMSEEAITADQVIVSASKHEMKISELPVSAIAILPQEFEKKNIISIDEALRYVPGVHMNLDQISIRGSSDIPKVPVRVFLPQLTGFQFIPEIPGR